VKRSNSVFNNFSESRFSSHNKKYSSRNGFLDTHIEFANEFIDKDKQDNQYHEVRERNRMRDSSQLNPSSSRKKNTG